MAIPGLRPQLERMTMTLEELSKKMRKIDFTMLATHTEGGQVAQRPMSNNGEVDFDGDSYYFAWDSSRMVKDISGDPKVGLSFQGTGNLLGKPGLMVAVEGRARILRDKPSFLKHWNKDLDRWFKQGVDTPGLALIHVQAERIHYWDGEEDGEITRDLEGSRA